MQTFAPFAARVSAAARALASRGTNPLINDPFAEPSVRAVGLDILTRLAGGEVDPVDMFGMRRMADMVGCRRCGGGRGDAHIQLAEAIFGSRGSQHPHTGWFRFAAAVGRARRPGFAPATLVRGRGRAANALAL